MRFLHALSLFCFFCCSAFTPLCGDLVGTYPANGGFITISPAEDSVELISVEFAANIGSLGFSGTSYPFEDSLAGNSKVSLLNYSSNSVRLNGSLVLGVSVSPNAEVEGRFRTEQNWSDQDIIPFELTKVEEPKFQLRGNISNSRITLHGEGGPARLDELAIIGLDLAGGLNPAPFSQLVTNSESEWRVSSDNDVFIDGSVTLDVQVSPYGPIRAELQDGVDSATLWLRGQTPLPTDQQVIGTYPISGGPISIQATRPTPIRQLQLIADGGFLDGGEQAAPFSSVSSNSAGEWVAESTADVIISGSVTLDVHAGPNTTVRGFALAQDGSITDFPLYGMSPASADSQLVGLFPSEGGPLTVFPQSQEGVSGFPSPGGLDFKDAAGTLANGSNPSPFQFFITGDDGQDKSQITMGSLGGAPTIASPTTLDITIGENAELTATWGDGTTPAPFPIFGGANMTCLTREPDLLTGSYPMSGGPVSIRSTDKPVRLRSLRLSTTKGELAGSDNAAPFETVEINNETEWAVASSATVVIDGEIVLDVLASPFAMLKGEATTPGNETIELPLNSFTEFVHQSEIVGVFPEEGGDLTLFATEEAIETERIVLSTDGESTLVGIDPAPFDQFAVDPNDPSKLSLISTSGPVRIDEPLTLAVRVPLNANVFGSWGDGVNSAFPTIPVKTVPEPNSSVFALIATLVFSLLRRNRSQ